MVKQYYPAALRTITCIVAICSAVSATLLGMAPLPQGLKVLDPLALRTTAVVLVMAFGVVGPVAVLIAESLQSLLLKVGVFAAAAFSNALTLSPYLVVPFQETSALIAVVCSLVLTVGSIVAYMDSVADRNAQKNVRERGTNT